ncbi:hypothetical protein D9619_013204 [Psilocybe cf. subviscida]|uniref:Fungal-type protein kinase domain-containing protein n=1 Tax=Psilocybe cf. subviscida TaxID=2480587 RepID=A0A8H5EZ96_9AGAR|nr:hypothetical protein D9619_013204 [Psilocybe cf. subviscida]
MADEEGEGFGTNRLRTSQQTPQVRKISSSRRVEPEYLKWEAMSAAQDQELAECTFEDVKGLVEWAFPQDGLAFSVDATMSKLLEAKVLQLKKGKYSWSQLPSAIKKLGDNGSSETALMNFLQEVTTSLEPTTSDSSPPTTDARVWRTGRKTALQDGPSTARRYPDVCLVAKDAPLSWKTVLGMVQLKYLNRRHLSSTAFDQLKHDAFTAFSSQDSRRFYVGVTICG